ncbi:hypothetical protein A7982_12786 [Minicystis rosea]|nr:hypothetical protein A7982_12786 [Minicystis rosea]
MSPPVDSAKIADSDPQHDSDALRAVDPSSAPTARTASNTRIFPRPRFSGRPDPVGTVRLARTLL